jgi:hypothetical protein
VHKETATPTFNVIKTLKIRDKKLNFISFIQRCHSGILRARNPQGVL